MNLSDAQSLAHELIEKHLKNHPTIKSRHPWVFKFDNARRRFGRCSYGKKTGYIISLSQHLTMLNDPAQVKDVILHEIAHALDVELRGYSNHDASWKHLAVSIGCDGMRCYDSTKVSRPAARYIATCETCEKKYTRHRKPKSEQSCGNCCKTFNPKYKIIFVDTKTNEPIIIAPRKFKDYFN